MSHDHYKYQNIQQTMHPPSNNSFQHSNFPDANNIPPLIPGMYDNPNHQPSSYPLPMNNFPTSNVPLPLPANMSVANVSLSDNNISPNSIAIIKKIANNDIKTDKFRGLWEANKHFQNGKKMPKNN